MCIIIIIRHEFNVLYCKEIIFVSICIDSESLQPTWEETIVFNERLTNFTDNENVIIFFELLDFSTSSFRHTSRQRTVANSEQTPWYHIAWGFLRPAGKISKSMMGRRSRVQLYKFPKRRLRSSTESKEVRICIPYSAKVSNFRYNP